jgi:multidrug resistance efflux pump
MKDFIELRSEEVQEILGTPPGWLVRWGTAVVLTGFVLMFVAAWFVRYPDVIKADVVLSTTVPPVDVVVQSEGRIAKLMARDRQTVQAGDLLAVHQTAANYEHVLELGMSVDAWQRSPTDSLKLVEPTRLLVLGDLQNDYATFLQELDNFKFGRSNRSASVRSNIGSIQQQIAQLEQSIAFDNKALKRVNDQLRIAEELYQQQKKLYDEGIVSRVDFEKERTKLADLERQRDIYDDNILRKRNEIITLRSGINTASLGQQETSSSATSRLQSALGNLQSAYTKWRQANLFFAPISGRVSLGNVSEQQFLRSGEVLLTIVPPFSDKVVGRVSLPISGSGKVKQGQQVIIKLDGYPYHEFGSLTGMVVSKSLVPKDNQYVILVSLPVTAQNNLRTNYGKEIVFEQQLQGKAEIVTNDKGFLERIGEQVFAGF